MLEFKTYQTVRANNVDDTLNEASAEGWELVPHTFAWDETRRNAQFLMAREKKVEDEKDVLVEKGA